MNNIPPKLRKQLGKSAFYKVCARRGLHDHACGGRITWEHALIHAGKQVQKEFAIVPLCAKAHGVDQFQDGGDLSKEINLWIALNRATEPELLEISRAVNYFMQLSRLNKKYGRYVSPVAPHEETSGIMYPWLQSPFSIV